MMPGRRPIAAAVLGLFALGGVAACQQDPAVAAYVGDVEITEERVETVTADVRQVLADEVEEQLGELEDPTEEELGTLRGERLREVDESIAGLRDRVVEMLVITEAGTSYAEVEGIELAPPEPGVVAQQVGLEPDHTYVEVVAGFFTVTTALQEAAEPAEVTEADQREIHENLVVEGQPVTEPFDTVQGFLTDDLLGGPVGMRDLLVEVVEQADVRVNPRYDLVYRVPVSLGQASSWLGVPLGEPSSVIDSD